MSQIESTERRNTVSEDIEVASIPVEPAPETVHEEYEEEEPLLPVYTFVGPAILSLVFFSMIGVLVRVYLMRLFTYDKNPVYGLIWVQMVGCFLMGIAMRTKGVLLHLSPSLNLGYTTGLCGSITTFSTWHLGIFQEFFNTNEGHHSRFKNFLGGMSVLVTTMGCSIAAIRLGQMVGDEIRIACDLYFQNRAHKDNTQLTRVATRDLDNRTSSRHDGWLGWDKWEWVDLMLVICGIAGVVATCLVIAMAVRTRSVSIALLFGPVGTLLRWRLSALNLQRPQLWLFPKSMHWMPAGTLIANVFGTAILAIVHILQTGAVIAPSWATCYALAALADGFCGCLTTVSTFAAEINTLSSRRAMLYFGISTVVAQSLFILIAGIYYKTATVDYSIC